jgi:glycosyltransferase involved in cell wall biosynthesis
MKTACSPPLLYVSFDQVPSAKGASTHIEANVRALGARFGSVILVSPGPRDLPARPFAPGVRQIVLGCPDRDLVGRVLTFRAKLEAVLRRQAFDLIHFRSPYEGYPLARHKAALGAHLVFEVNGLPSIELKYSRPGPGAREASLRVDPGGGTAGMNPAARPDAVLLAKLLHQEGACLAAADRVVTVSEVSRACLVQRGCDPAKITILRNGVDLETFPYRDPLPPTNGPLRILYAGTLSPWQGVDVLLEALRRVVVERPVQLTLVGPAGRQRLAELHRRAGWAGLGSCVSFLPPVPRAELAGLLHASHVAAVPLTSVDRNTVQGCCPLKLLEAMAAGCPVVASDLPVVREVAEPGRHFLGVPPDDPAGLALALLRAGREHQENGARARAARHHVERHFRWECSTARLVALYEELLGSPASSSARAACSAGSE